MHLNACPKRAFTSSDKQQNKETQKMKDILLLALLTLFSLGSTSCYTKYLQQFGGDDDEQQIRSSLQEPLLTTAQMYLNNEGDDRHKHLLLNEEDIQHLYAQCELYNMKASKQPNMLWKNAFQSSNEYDEKESFIERSDKHINRKWLKMEDVIATLFHLSLLVVSGINSL